MTRASIADLALASVALLGAVYLMVHAAQVSDGPPLSTVGPYTWPFVSLTILTLCAAILLLGSVLALVRAWTNQMTPLPAVGGAVNQRARPLMERIGPVLLMFLTLVLIWSLPTVGFAVGTLVWFPVVVAVLGHVRPRTIVVSSLVFYLLTYGIFIAWLGLSLPRGRGVFAQISRALGI